MGLLIGPTPWWQSLVVSTAPVGTTLPDGSIIICKAGGTAWIIAPGSTQVNQSFNNNTDSLLGNKCCVCDWPTLNTRLINCGFNPADWFIPTIAQLQNPGQICNALWDAPKAAYYWSATEFNATNARGTCLANTNNCCDGKSNTHAVRAFRCVTY
jgi:hypothetical protein